MGSRVFLVLTCVVGAFVWPTLSGGAGTRDDTAWLQAKLDAGGTIFLPRLPNDECYRTRGLWLSRDDTEITSDGACIVALGPGEARFKDAAGHPVRATSVFRLDHSNLFGPLPIHVTISDLDIRVPASTKMSGIVVFGGETTLERVTIGGAPVTDVVVGSGRAGAAGLIERVAIRDCNLSGGQRDVLFVAGPIGLQVEHNLFAGARDSNAAGFHLRSADRGQAVLDVHVTGNTITGNAGPGIFADLDPTNGAPILADGIELSNNEISGNAGAGVVLAGGQDDGKGEVVLTNNVIRGNRGAGIRGRHFRLTLVANGNDLRENKGGAARGLTAASTSAPPSSMSWTPPPAQLENTAGRDDTAWLQARLDARGGTIFLPRLPSGECYATHGLWVWRDDTTITSDGACIVSLGPGAVRQRSPDGDPIPSSALFYISRTSSKKPAPVRITISNLSIVVPESGEPMYGVAVYGHEITLSNLNISGSPKDDVTIGARANGNGYASHIALLNSTLSGATRNAVSAYSVIDLRIEGNTIEGVRDSPPGQPAAGIDVEPDDRGQPTLGVRILHNTIRDNAGPGILLPLETNSGPALIATDLEISGNTVVRNANKRTPPTRAGIAIVGGQDGGEGTLSLTNNVIRDNGGPGILTRLLRLVVTASGNQLSGNDGD